MNEACSLGHFTSSANLLQIKLRFRWSAFEGGQRRAGSCGVVTIRSCRIAAEYDVFHPNTVTLCTDPHLIATGTGILLITFGGPVLASARERNHLENRYFNLNAHLYIRVIMSCKPFFGILIKHREIIVSILVCMRIWL